MIKNPKIDLLDPQTRESKDFKEKNPWLKLAKFSFYLVAVLGILFFFFSSRIIFPSDESVFANIKSFSQNYLFDQLKQMTGSSHLLRGEENDRINFLLLGIGGKGHQGPNLTDTIILGSYKPSSGQLALISIPRDLVVPLPGYGWRKINTLNVFGGIDNDGQGAKFTADFISQLLDLPIQYHFLIDFSGFEELIDTVGGVEIFVENSLNDYQYPVKGKANATEEARYEHLYIEQGLQEMDGKLALKYARSRHALPPENSDFARSRRQQKLLLAVKDKVLSYKILLSPNKILKILNTLEDNIQTNIKLSDISRMMEIARDFDNNRIINQVLDNGPDGPLVANMYDGASVLEPRADDFSEIKSIVSNIFDQTFVYTMENKTKTLLGEFSPKTSEIDPAEAAETDKQAEPELEIITQDSLPVTVVTKKEEATIEILNGTWITGLAAKTELKLVNDGYDVINIGNAQTHDYEKTVIYSLNNNQFPKTTDYLKKEITSNLLTSGNQEISQADFLIILGRDAN